MRKILAILALLSSAAVHAQLVQNPLVVPSTTFVAGHCIQATGPNSIATTGSACGTGSGGSGNVTGPTSSVVNDLAAFSNATGSGILDTGVAFSHIGLLGATQTWAGTNTFNGDASFAGPDPVPFALRPTFSGATPWDSLNFNPANYLPLTGGTLSGQVAYNGAAGSLRGYTLQTGGLNRWYAGTDTSSESGGNSGSNWILNSYGDNGAAGITALSIARATGLVDFAVRPEFGTNTPWDSGNFNPANYALLSGANAFAVRPTFAGNTPWDSGNFTPINYLTTAAAATTYAPIANPTFSSTATVHGNWMTVNNSSGTFERYTTNTNNSPTWEFGTDGQAQTGSNAGSNFGIWAIADSQATLYQAVSINRATGATALYSRPTFGGNLAWDAGNFNPANYAALSGSAFSGTLTNSAAQPVVTDSSTHIPTTAWVQGAISSAVTGGTVSPTFSGTTTVQNLTATGIATFGSATEFNGASTFANEAQFNAPATFTSTGASSFAVRPTFNGATPWDSSNFTPSNYLTTTAAASTYVPLQGTVTMSGIYTFSNIPQVATAPTGDNSQNAASTNFVTSALGAAIGEPIVIDQSYRGANPPPLLTPNQIVFANLSPRSTYLVPVYTEFECIVNPSTNTVFSVQFDGAVIGTMTLSSGCTATWSLPGNDVNQLPVARGGQLRIVAPASPDGLLAGLSISMGGYATASLGH